MPTENKITAPEESAGVDFGIDGRSVRVSQEAYSIFLAREAAGREKIAALQQRLTAADQRIDELTIPDGYCIMPARLTAENGAKGLLLGEFKLSVTQDCPECADMEEPSELCSICDGEGEFGQRHTIPWDQIKFIYSKAVSGLAVQAPNHQSAPESVALDERTEFVKWVRREWPQAPLSNVRDLLPKSDPRYGEYCDETLQRAWVGWQARAALAGKF